MGELELMIYAGQLSGSWAGEMEPGPGLSAPSPVLPGFAAWPMVGGVLFFPAL